MRRSNFVLLTAATIGISIAGIAGVAARFASHRDGEKRGGVIAPPEGERVEANRTLLGVDGRRSVPADRSPEVRLPDRVEVGDRRQKFLGNKARISTRQADLRLAGSGIAKASLSNQPAAPTPDRSVALPRHVTDMSVDATGRLWIATEGDGLWLREDATSSWKRFSEEDGLAENECYSVYCSRDGSVWVGHVTKGVSVLRNGTWQVYEPVAGSATDRSKDGPLGCRVFDIAQAEAGEDIWIGTSFGVARYSPTTERWHSYTRNDGLPSDQVRAITFRSNGDIAIGTLCDGIAIASKEDDFNTWKSTRIDDRSIDGATSGCDIQINDIAYQDDGILYVATDDGLLRLSNDLSTAVRFRAVPANEAAVKPAAIVDPHLEVLADNYVTAVICGASGELYVSFRSGGWQRFSRDMQETGGDVGRHFVSAVALLPRDRIAVGTYGDEPVFIGPLPPSRVAAALPDYQRAVDEATHDVSTPSIESKPTGEKLLFCRQDWSTRGDWVGAYGAEYSVLCGASAPMNHYGRLARGYRVEASLGDVHRPGDSLRYWIHWLETSDRRSLWDPVLAHRRQAEWDDHGETYPVEMPGPNLRLKIYMPPGDHQIAFYFVNKDGKAGRNRHRDYVVSLSEPKGVGNAHTRVVDFWGGCYAVFLSRGCTEVEVKVDRNRSTNTILSGVFIDRIKADNSSLPASTGREASQSLQKSIERLRRPATLPEGDAAGMRRKLGLTNEVDRVAYQRERDQDVSRLQELTRAQDRMNDAPANVPDPVREFPLPSMP